eukprot:COSAG02_NODE_1139_length_14295_cov_63.689279_2_plen_88_part_00
MSLPVLRKRFVRNDGADGVDKMLVPSCGQTHRRRKDGCTTRPGNTMQCFVETVRVHMQAITATAGNNLEQLLRRHLCNQLVAPLLEG